MTFDKSLAGNNRLNKTAVPTLLLIILLFVSFNLVNESTSGTAIVTFTIIALVLIALIFNGYKSKDIYYDNSNMYLKGDKGTLVVPFSNVKRLGLTLGNAAIMGFRFYQYKIEYIDEQGRLSEVYFWTFIMNPEMDDFEKCVKKINPQLKVEHWATNL